MNDNQWIAVVVVSWFALWSTEVIVAKLYLGEEVPFWLYGVQSLLAVTILIKFSL